MAVRFLKFSALVVVAACSSAAQQRVSDARPSAAPGPDEAAATITVADVQRRVAFLASDELRGRDTPSPGLERAAAYIADEFRSFGLQPAGDSGTFIQRFPYGAARLDAQRVSLTISGHGSTVAPAFTREFFVLPSQSDSISGVPIFAGIAAQGVTAPADARGRIIIYFVPGGMGPQWQQAAATALQTGFAAGAAAIVLALDSAFTQSEIGELSDAFNGQTGPLSVVGLSFAHARTLLGHGGIDINTLRSGTAVQAKPLDGVSLTLRTPVTATQDRVPNVVAILPGSDPTLRNEYIVFSAHMDHVGVGTPDASGDSIYNGADDDASGTTAVLEVAEAFARLNPKPARSLMFLLVSGEEKGLLGSAHFVEHAPVPLSQIVANINIDMIGRNARDTVVAIGQDYSSLGPSAQQAAREHRDLGLVVAPDLWPEERLFFRSDHFSFAAKEIPAIFFTTGLHADYHKPSDEPETIDNDKLMRVARLVFRLGHDLAVAPQKPQWTPTGLAEVRRATSGRN